MTLRALRRVCRAENGATLVEFALVAPVFFVLLFGTIEFGRALWTQQALQETATAGARCMALPQPACASGGAKSYIQQVANQWGLSLLDSNINPNPANTCGSSGISGFSTVLLTYTFQSVAAAFVQIPSGGITLTAQACFPNNP